MQHLEVSGAVRHIYIYIYIYMCVIRRLKVKGKEIGGRQWLGKFRSWVLSGVLNVLINAGAMADIR